MARRARPPAADDFSVAADAMAKLLNLPEDEKQVTRERRAEWNARLARTLRRLGRWADAAARFTAAATWSDPTPSRRERTAAFLEAAECALEEDAERAKTAGKEAIETASRRTIVSPAASRAMAAAGARAHAARPNPALESAVRTFLDAEDIEGEDEREDEGDDAKEDERDDAKDDEGDDANRAHRVRGAPLARASARLALAPRPRRAGAAAKTPRGGDAVCFVEGRPAFAPGGRRSRGARCRARGCRGVGRGMGRGGGGLGGGAAFAEESKRCHRRAAPLVALVPADALEHPNPPRSSRGFGYDCPIRAVPGAADASRTSRGPRRAPRCSPSETETRSETRSETRRNPRLVHFARG